MDKTLEMVGKLLTKDTKRDAVHFALAPVIANEPLTPGTHVGLVQGFTDRVGHSKETIGIIDPFLDKVVKTGQVCWLFLYPATITSLRHEWIHPAFSFSPAQARMEELAAQTGYTYDKLMCILQEGESTDYISMGDDESGASELNSCSDALWDTYEAITGRKTKRPYFSCAC